MLNSILQQYAVRLFEGQLVNVGKQQAPQAQQLSEASGTAAFRYCQFHPLCSNNSLPGTT